MAGFFPKSLLALALRLGCSSGFASYTREAGTPGPSYPARLNPQPPRWGRRPNVLSAQLPFSPLARSGGRGEVPRGGPCEPGTEPSGPVHFRRTPRTEAELPWGVSNAFGADPRPPRRPVPLPRPVPGAPRAAERRERAAVGGLGAHPEPGRGRGRERPGVSRRDLESAIQSRQQREVLGEPAASPRGGKGFCNPRYMY